MAQDCLFCRIIEGEIPSSEVLSTPTTFAFRDVDPQAPSHVLVVPRRHIRDASTVTAADGSVLADMVLTAHRVATAEHLDDGYRLVFNVGEDAGNTVPHLHLHVVGGRKLAWPPG